MFGFLRGPACDREYRSLYARACQSHYLQNGRVSALFHSYEAVFLYALASDLSVIRKPSPDDPSCCRLMKRFAFDESEREVGRFVASFAMLLLTIKLLDDWQDDRSLLVGLGMLWTKRAKEKSFQQFEAVDPNFRKRIASILDQHTELEKSKRELTLEEFQSATSEGFEYIFELFAKHCSFDRKISDQLKEIGRNVGAAIIAYDCAVDWHRDRLRRQFNPLRDSSQVKTAFQQSLDSLDRVRVICSQLSPDDGISQRIVETRMESIEKRIRGLELQPCVPAALVFSMPRAKNRSWRRSIPVIRLGECDCFCPADGCGDAAEGCCNVGDGISCCCDCPIDCCFDRNEKKKKKMG